MPFAGSRGAGYNAPLLTSMSIEWQMSAAILLLGVAAGLVRLLGHGPTGGHYDRQFSPQAEIIWFLTLAVAALAAIWPRSLPGMLGGWLALDVVWLAGLVRFERALEGPRRPLLRLAVLLLSLLCMALAWSATAGAPSPLDFNNLPRPAAAWLLLAAVIHIGAFPFHFWRPEGPALPPAVAALFYALPVAAGSVLLARLAGTGALDHLRLPVTILGLSSVLGGAVAAWLAGEEKARALRALAVAQAALLPLTALWAGSGAVVAVARVLILAVGVILLATALERFEGPVWAYAGPLTASFSLVGAPLSIGMAGRAALFESWLAHGRIILVIVAIAIQVLLLGVALRLIGHLAPARLRRAPSDEPERKDTTDPALLPPGWRRSAIGVALLIPLVGLLAVAPLLSGARLITWLALLLSVAGGLALAFLDAKGRGLGTEAVAAWRQSMPGLPYRRVMAEVGRLIALLGGAVREAGRLLEGEGGMLWLLLWVVIFWLASQA
jgi:hypothetical protein